MPATTARWRRPPPDPGHRPVVAYPPPPRPDPGPAAHNPGLYDGYNLRLYPGSPAAETVSYTPPPTVSPAAARTAPPPGWQPAPAAPPDKRPTARPGSQAVIWSLPQPPVPRAPAISPGRFQITTPPPPCGDGINYDPPPEAGGTGLQQTMPDGSWVVHPLSVIHPGSQVGDEGPVNEAFLSTPVVHLCAGRPYALSSALVVPNGATLYLNRAALDRTMIQAGEGAVVYD